MAVLNYILVMYREDKPHSSGQCAVIGKDKTDTSYKVGNFVQVPEETFLPLGESNAGTGPWRACGISIPGDMAKAPGQVPEQPLMNSDVISKSVLL